MIDKFKILMIFMIIGSICGAIFSMMINEEVLEKLVGFMFLNQDKNILQFIFKVLKYFLGIWFLGFISYGYLFVYLLNFSKGFSIGFSSCVLFIAYKLDIMKFLFDKYFFENCIIVLSIFYISYKSIRFCQNKMNKNDIDFNNYLICLIFLIILNSIIYFIF